MSLPKKRVVHECRMDDARPVDGGRAFCFSQWFDTAGYMTRRASNDICQRFFSGTSARANERNR